MGDQEDVVSQFTAITGVTAEQARFYLDSAAGSLDVAMERYYENDGGDDDDVQHVPTLPKQENTGSNADLSKPHPVRKPPTSNIATLNTLESSESDKEDDDEEEGQAFYAGGSEHSGQQVLGPRKKKDFVSGMFKSIKEHGVEIVDKQAGPGTSTFRGTGYKLGQTSSDSEVIANNAEDANTRPPQITLRLWSNGFSIDDGALRQYENPANRDFLRSIQHGEIPQELRRGDKEVHITMEDHRMEKFRKALNASKPFTGAGYKLGSPAPPIVGAQTVDDKGVNEAAAKKAVEVDQAQPTTSIQIRLEDGTRLVAQFNHEHTISHVRNYIVTARPQYANRHFQLLSNFPIKAIEDEDQTLAQAGLLNAAIMQKLM